MQTLGDKLQFKPLPLTPSPTGGGCPKTPFLIFETFVLKLIMLKHKT